MQKLLITFGIALILSVTASPSLAGDVSEDSPWEKFSFNAGFFASTASTDIQFGSGLGVSVNLEDALGLDAKNQVFRLDTYWRFTDNRRHRADFTWFAFRRTASRNITEDITVNPPGGDPIEIPSGTTVESYMDLDIFEVAYRYSFIQDDRLDLAAGVGLYIMPISMGLSATGFVDEEGDQSFTAPLPVANLKLDVLIAPKWYFRSGWQLFYVEYDGFTGSLNNVRSAVEYNPWKHVGLGLGIDALRMYVEGNGQQAWPETDLRGTVDFNYVGLYFYGRVFF